ncbi:guanylate kinase [Fusarium heterosporum]|uniref:Guanylate kinase n=1 Tax=Fusarium heterosporum TaxID=42747 RepID=A0A8H5T1D8_FUSHE|nr:guanylate kinase [Fusarium heterosporum]
MSTGPSSSPVPLALAKGTYQVAPRHTPLSFALTVSHTSRPPDPDEDERSYQFTNGRSSERSCREAPLLSVLRSPVITTARRFRLSIRGVLDQDLVTLPDIDMKGANAMRKLERLDARYTFISPYKVFMIDTCIRRKDTESEASIQERITQAEDGIKHYKDHKQHYKKHWDAFDFIIASDDYEQSFGVLERFALSGNLSLFDRSQRYLFGYVTPVFILL